ncbi:hypothetical protein ABZ958_27275 [Streptomyces sp. NPDC046237]
MLTINVAVLLVVVVLWRLRRRTEAAPTVVGQGILNVPGELASGVTQAGR